MLPGQVHIGSFISKDGPRYQGMAEKSTGRPVLCFFRVFYIEISTKCSLLCLSYSLEEGSLGLSGRRAIFGERGGS